MLWAFGTRRSIAVQCSVLSPSSLMLPDIITSLAALRRDVYVLSKILKSYSRNEECAYRYIGQIDRLRFADRIVGRLPRTATACPPSGGYSSSAPNTTFDERAASNRERDDFVEP